MRVDSRGALAKLDQAALVAQQAALREAAEVADEAMQEATPVRTGNMQRSIRSNVGRRRATTGTHGIPYAQPVDRRHRIRERTIAAVRASGQRIAAAAKAAVRAVIR